MHSHSDKMIVKSILDLSHNIGVDVTAEGVETDEQLVFLAENKCTNIQVFLLCQPLSFDELTQQLSR